MYDWNWIIIIHVTPPPPSSKVITSTSKKWKTCLVLFFYCLKWYGIFFLILCWSSKFCPFGGNVHHIVWFLVIIWFNYIIVIFFVFFVIPGKYVQMFLRYTCSKMYSEKTDMCFFCKTCFLNSCFILKYNLIAAWNNNKKQHWYGRIYWD